MNNTASKSIYFVIYDIICSSSSSLVQINTRKVITFNLTPQFLTGIFVQPFDSTSFSAP